MNCCSSAFGRRCESIVASSCLVFLISLLGGCASAGGTLPYSVGVFYDASASDLPASRREDNKVRFAKSSDELVAAIANAMEAEDGIVTHARALSARSLEEALPAAGDLDLLLAVSFETPTSYNAVSRPVPTAILEVVAWLFGGVPAWFVPSVEYDTSARLNVKALDLNRPEVRRLLERDANVGGGELPAYDSSRDYESATQALSLWDRSSFSDDFGDYFMTLFVPPMFVVPGNPQRTSDSITEMICCELREKLGEGLTATLNEQESSRSMRIVVSPDQIVEGSTLSLVFMVESDKGAPLDAIYVRRLGGDGVDFRRKSRPELVASLNEKLRAGQGSGVEVVIPVDLVKGRNLVQVRVVAKDGGSVSRTLNFVNEGEE